MLKKILITLFIVPVIGVAIYGYFHFKQIKTPLSPVIQAIPTNAAAILKCNTPKASLQNFSMANPVWKTLITYPFFGEMHTQMRFLDALFPSGSEAFKTIQDKPLFISAHPDASNNYGLLYLMNLPNNITKKQLNDFIKNAAVKSANYSMKIYDGVALNELKLKEDTSFYYFFNKGIFACTFSQYLIEDAIKQLNSGIPISADPAFDKVWNSAGKKVEATLFVNYFNFSQIFTNVLENSRTKLLKPLSTFANWTSLDIKTKGNSYQMSGFTFSKDTSNNYLTILKGQEAQEIEIAEQIPASTAYFHCYALSDVSRFFKNYDTYLNNLTDHYTRQEQLNLLNKKYDVNAQNFFKQWLGNQFAFVINESNSSSFDQNCYAVFQSNGSKDVSKTLSDFNLKIRSRKSSSDTLNELFRGYTIGHIPVESLVPLVFGESFEQLTQFYYVQLKNYVVVGNSSEAIKKWVNIKLAGHTLSEDADYNTFAENNATQSNLYYYFAPARSSELLQQYVKKDLLNWSAAKFETLKNFHALSFQLSANQNLFYTNLFAEYKPCYKKASESIFETDLDTVIHTQPWPLRDAADSSVKIFVQDDALKIYLIDNTGKVLWKKAMKEKITSEVQAVHTQKDKSLQILFSTKTKIYLLDKEGDNVGKFPVVLKYLATNGVKAVDYDHTGDYRFIIAEENKRIYNYSSKGDAVNGWEAVVNADKVVAPVNYFRAKGLDYLTILDQSGNLNLLDRKGKSVVKFKQKLKNAYRNTYYLIADNTLNASSIVTCDSTGKITRLYFSGKIESNQVSKMNQEFYFLYDDAANNFTFVTKNKLEVFGADWNKKAESKLNLATLWKPEITKNLGPKSGILISDADKNLMSISSDGKLQSSIPCLVTTAPAACQLFGDASWYTAIGVRTQLHVYAGY